MTKHLLLALALAGSLTACGGGSSHKATVIDASPTASSTASTSSASSATSTCPATPTSKDLKVKPAASLPAASTSPATTTFTDVVVGKGAEAKAGSHVTVKYVGVLFTTCKEFDSSWSRGAQETLPFTVGNGVIPGFSKGVTGMHVGGRRQVVIPAAEGYGDQDSGPIPGGSTLVFVIDLVSAA